MDKDTTVNKALMSMQMKGIIFEDAVGEARIFLGQVYVAGYEAGTKITGEHQKREIIKCNNKGKKLAKYGSILEAARRVHCSDRILNRALKSGKATRAGNIWKYAETDGND